MRVMMWAFLGLALAGCGAKPEPPATTAGETAAWVGKENIVLADQREMQVGPSISGSLEAERRAVVRAELTAAVVEVSAEPGQPVSRGAVLGRLDDSAIRDAWQSSKSAAKTAELTSELAQRNATRAEALNQAGAIAARDLETAQWNATNAQAQRDDALARLASAEKQLARTVIRAPFSGVVAERPVSLGDVVQSGNPLFTVVDPGSLKFEGTVPVEALAGLKVGTPVSLWAAGAADRIPIQGRITRINPSVDPATRQVRVTVGVTNPKGQLIAGLFAEGRVATSTRNSIVVPSGAVDRRGIRPYVVRLKGGRVERIEVDLGLIDQATDQLEVAKGLTPGDTLLLGGARGLTPGTLVRIGSPAELTDRQAAGPAAGE